jgi:hypothetical protein
MGSAKFFYDVDPLNDPHTLNIRKKNDERFIVSLKNLFVALKRKIEKRFYDGIIPLPFFVNDNTTCHRLLDKNFHYAPFFSHPLNTLDSLNFVEKSEFLRKYNGFNQSGTMNDILKKDLKITINQNIILT